ncbi:MAG: hypothetical protein MJ252_23005 [archaeon]|nr:hypothetical protein [archaeon]
MNNVQKAYEYQDKVLIKLKKSNSVKHYNNLMSIKNRKSRYPFNYPDMASTHSRIKPTSSK